MKYYIVIVCSSCWRFQGRELVELDPDLFLFAFLDGWRTQPTYTTGAMEVGLLSARALPIYI